MVKVRTKKRSKTLSHLARQVFEERPDLLESSSNEELVALFRERKPRASDKMVERFKNLAANVKSRMRKEQGIAVNGRGGRQVSRSTLPMGWAGKLDMLEEHIDECLVIARTIDPEGLVDVIQSLRNARNQIIRMIGE